MVVHCARDEHGTSRYHIQNPTLCCCCGCRHRRSCHSHGYSNERQSPIITIIIITIESSEYMRACGRREKKQQYTHKHTHSRARARELIEVMRKKSSELVSACIQSQSQTHADAEPKSIAPTIKWRCLSGVVCATLTYTHSADLAHIRIVRLCVGQFGTVRFFPPCSNFVQLVKRVSVASSFTASRCVCVCVRVCARTEYACECVLVSLASYSIQT